jgi:hypothetical protein
MGELRYAGRRVPTRRRRLTVDLCAQMDLCLMIFVLSAIHPDKMVHALQAPRPTPPPCHSPYRFPYCMRGRLPYIWEFASRTDERTNWCPLRRARARRSTFIKV